MSLSVSLKMPGRPHVGELAALTPGQAALAQRLRRDIEWIAGEIGERHIFRPGTLVAAEEGLRRRLTALGLSVRRQPFMVDGHECVNLWADVEGTSGDADAAGSPGERASGREVVVYGAHYDSVRGCPAANDNGTGVAAVLELARELVEGRSAERLGRTVRLAFFVNEEPPHFWTERMGSLVLARAFKAAGDRIVGMLTPETIGCYSDASGSQAYPLPLGWAYPTTGNFVAFIGLPGSRELLRRSIGVFRETTAFPSIGAVLPGTVPGVGSSDHWSFWRMGYPALMVTDTAPFRYPYYHTPEDTPDKVHYAHLARVVEGLGRVVQGVCRGEAAINDPSPDPARTRSGR